jgi:hypothetical protein
LSRSFGGAEWEDEKEDALPAFLFEGGLNALRSLYVPRIVAGIDLVVANMGDQQ